jgi:AraC family carnitine catabolism transcriptional activator
MSRRSVRTRKPLSDASTRPSSTAPSRSSPHRIGAILTPQFSYLGLALLLEPLHIANWLSQSTLFEWSLLSADGGPVPASNGLTVETAKLPSRPGTTATFFVLASFDPKTIARNKRLLTWLRREYAFGSQIAGIETGTEVLAAAGLLNGRQAAIHWDNLEGFQENYPDVRANARWYTLDARIATCAGATAVTDLILDWIGQRAGADLTKEIGQHLLHTQLRPPDAEQLKPLPAQSATGNTQVAQAIRLMKASLQTPPSCAELASAVRLSRRHFERQFKRCTGMAPVRYFLSLRLALAHQLLQQTDMAVSEVAAASGFRSFEHFSRIYKLQFGRAPSGDRRQSPDAPVMRMPER